MTPCPLCLFPDVQVCGLLERHARIELIAWLIVWDELQRWREGAR